MNEKKQKIKENVSHWLQHFILKYNICPFARLPFEKGLIRIAVNIDEPDFQRLDFLQSEILKLHQTKSSELSNTLCIFESAEKDFRNFLDFKEIADDLLLELGLDHEFQLVPFHPKFIFATTSEHARINWVNRSPYPLLHILREVEVSSVLTSLNDGENISHINEKKLEAMSSEEWSNIVTMTQNSGL